MSQSVVDKWQECKPSSLGSVLFEILTRWQNKVQHKEDNGRERFVNWVREMQLRGMFPDCEAAPPKMSDFSMFLKLATGSRNQARSKLQYAGLLHRGKADKEAKTAETFFTDCLCFIGEVKFSIQSMSSALVKQQLPAMSLTLDQQSTESKDNTPSQKQSKPYTEARAMLDTLQHQLPQVEGTNPEETIATRTTSSASSESSDPLPYQKNAPCNVSSCCDQKWTATNCPVSR